MYNAYRRRLAPTPSSDGQPARTSGGENRLAVFPSPGPTARAKRRKTVLAIFGSVSTENLFFLICGEHNIS